MSRSSSQRCQLSQASPLGSAKKVPGRCSISQKSLLTLPPSTWWEAVAAPHRKPLGKVLFMR